MYARIDDNGHCAEFIDFDPAGKFHPSLKWMLVPDPLRPYVDHSYTATEDGEIQPPTLDYLRAQLKARVKERRKRAEEAGTTVNGTPVETDRESQSMLNGAVEYMRRNPGGVINWQLPDLSFIALDADKVGALADAVAAHVQSCFTRQAEICADMERRTKVSTLLEAYQDAIDTGWPGQEVPTDA